MGGACPISRKKRGKGVENDRGTWLRSQQATSGIPTRQHILEKEEDYAKFGAGPRRRITNMTKMEANRSPSVPFRTLFRSIHCPFSRY